MRRGNTSAMAKKRSGFNQTVVFRKRPGSGGRSIKIWGWVKTLVPLVNIKIAGKWMFIPLKMVLIGIDPYPFVKLSRVLNHKIRI